MQKYFNMQKYQQHKIKQVILLIHCPKQMVQCKILNMSSDCRESHRTVQIGRDLLRSSSSTFFLKQSYIEWVAQDHVQLGFEDVHRWILHTTSGQFVSVFNLSHSKLFSLVFGWIFLFLSLYPQHLVLSLGTAEESLTPSFAFPPSRCWYTLIRSFLNLFFSRLNSPSCLKLSSQERGSNPFIIFITLHWSSPGAPCHCCTGEARTGPQYSRCGLTKIERITSLDVLRTLLPPQIALCFSFC